MEESAAPWRALEDLPAAVGGTNPQADRHRPAPWVVILLIAAALLGLAAFWLAASTSGGTIGVEGAVAAIGDGFESPGASQPARPGGAGTSGGQLVVDVQGAVVRPGVIHLPAGSRVGDAVAAAGGFGPRVAAERVGRELNLAALLRDGDQIVVPSRDDTASAGGSVGPGSPAPGGGGGPIDLNSATPTELDALPGIGPVTANKIIAAREERPFASVDELRARKVLGAATFDKIKDLVVVR
jgi:competence protein ComEA